MFVRLVYAVLIAAVIATPSFAGYCDFKFAGKAGSPVAMTERDKASDPDGGLLCSHHCCLAHAQYGDRAPVTAIAEPLPAPGVCVPAIAKNFAPGSDPSPLLQPPSLA